MNRNTVALLVGASGFCGLAYQVVWFRAFRYVFGASTSATAVVLAVFMGGLGLGAAWFGRRAEATSQPLRRYAGLEAGIAVAALLSPWLLEMTRAAYIAAGGASALGPVPSAAVRVLLAAVVMGPATVLMGGTLPAAARAVTKNDDATRAETARLYGANAVGAVVGALAATLVLLEALGVRATLYLACAVNLAVAVGAILLARNVTTRPADVVGAEADPHPQPDPDPDADADADVAGPAAPPPPVGLVLVGAAGVGFAFFAMELTWYRMLAPLLGGSSYSFGLILAMALAGIATGGLGYAWRRPTPTLALFAATCGLEAVFLAIPYALGDRVALLALVLRELRVWGGTGLFAGWAVVTGLVVFPAAFVSGFQFPVVVGLLGRGRARLGRHVGWAYASNTVGTMAGALLGGFVLLPSLGALGTWRFCVLLLVGLGLAALGFAGRRHRRRRPAVGLAMLAPVPLLFLPLGPTAVWRHSPIGAGRAGDYLEGTTPNQQRREMHDRRRGITWEADGRESTVGLYTLNDTAFLVNGKSDGSAVLDGGTQVMGGLLGALLQPRPPRRALVIGLGTGSTAGWLAAMPEIERVDVIELEPTILDVARHCAPVNRHVLDNPKVRVIVGDARELLLTSSARYDLIFSEPSNPYRAGIASLFTDAFYRAVNGRLEDDGVFIQWLQTYEIDAKSVRIVYATLASRFPSVETWRTKSSDLVLLNRKRAAPLHVDRLRARMRQPPFREALLRVWRATRPEDVIARYVARPELARAIAAAEGPDGINTDDRNQLEYSIARALGRPQRFGVHDVLALADRLGGAHPPLDPAGGDYDDALRADGFISMAMAEGLTPVAPAHLREPSAVGHRRAAHRAWRDEDYPAVIRAWQAQSAAPTTPTELMVMADAFAVEGRREDAAPLIEALTPSLPLEAGLIEARLQWALRRPRAAWRALAPVLVAHRDDPWVDPTLLYRALALVTAVAEIHPDTIPEMRETLAVDFAVSSHRYFREDLLIELAMRAHDPAGCVAAHEPLEPWVPWHDDFLSRRVRCFALAGDDRLDRARADLNRYRRNLGPSFSDGVDLNPR
ncbi:MAG: fused MFS/spermidine synthase [Myxococcota bacterium]